MASFPILNELIINEPELEKLIQILLDYEKRNTGYEFESIVPYSSVVSPDTAPKAIPEIETPSPPYFHWSPEPIFKGTVATEITTLLKNVYQSNTIDKSFVLVAPLGISEYEKQWLHELIRKQGGGITLSCYGQEEIETLILQCPHIYKYYRSKLGNPESPAQDFLSLQQKYHSWILHKFKYLYFTGLPTGNYQKQKDLGNPELKKVYVPLELYLNQNEKIPFTLEKVVKKSKRTVILGHPGTGKSTLTRYLALKLCGDIPDKSSKDKTTPLIIPIREFAQKQKEKSHLPQFDFVDYLIDSAKLHEPLKNIDPDFFLALLELGKAFVIFDGLDEISAEAWRIQIVKDIETFSLRFPHTAIWVTSRIVGYEGQVRLNPQRFDVYSLAPVSLAQANTFIKKWYQIHIPTDEPLRIQRTQSLQKAVQENPGVEKLKANPLLLTMMTLVHQFEGMLPDNRVKLYEKCIELLLKTWQDQKYIVLGIKNPLEQRGLNYDSQLRLLTYVAQHIQEKALQQNDKETIGLITEKELVEILFKNWFDKRRMNAATAREDIRIFLDYIRDRAGLLVEKGKSQQGENYFAFVHFSFQEYLWAYGIAGDRSKSLPEQIGILLQYLFVPQWTESILLALHLLARFAGSSFVDDFVSSAFTRLAKDNNPNGWFLLGRAVKDNINFAFSDLSKIIRKILNIWLTNPANQTAFDILKEISLFSIEGKKKLQQVLKATISTTTAPSAFATLFLYQAFYGFDTTIPKMALKNKHYQELLPYLAVYRHFPLLKTYIREHLDIHHWVIFFASASDKSIDFFLRLGDDPINPVKINGYLLSLWRDIFQKFECRNRFIEKNQGIPEEKQNRNILVSTFANDAISRYPIILFQTYTNLSLKPSELYTITEHSFLKEDFEQFPTPKWRFICQWVEQITSTIFRQIEDKNKPQRLMRYLGTRFLRDFNRSINKQLMSDFFKDRLKGLSGEMLHRFIRSLNHYIGDQNFIQDLLKDFNFFFIEDLDTRLLSQFSNGLGKYANQIINGTTEFKNLFYLHFGINFESNGELSFPVSREKRNSVELEQLQMFNPDKFPLVFLFILASGLNAHLLHLLEALDSQFYEYKELDAQKITEAVASYCKKNPFILCLVSFFWDYYSRDFEKRYLELLKKQDAKSANLFMATFITIAAKISQITGQPCKGENWDKMLNRAEDTIPRDISVDIALTLYKLCNFLDRETNSLLLEQQLERFKQEYPEHYKLVLD